MWETKEFKFNSSAKSIENARKKRDAFIEKNKNKYQMEEVFIHNAYGIEYRKLRRVY